MKLAHKISAVTALLSVATLPFTTPAMAGNWNYAPNGTRHARAVGLRNASILFHTNNEDKDHDTHVTVEVKDCNNRVVAYTSKLTAPGGTVKVLGNQVALLDNALIDVSSATGGGTVLVGGDFQGKGNALNAAQTFVAPGVTINADALTTGNGGRVIVWADKATGFYGNISARGGLISGNGGFVEVSGKENLLFRGAVNTSAVHGSFGTLLLDPTNITITDGGAPGGFAGQVLSGDPVPTTISQGQLQSLPGNTNVILQATNSITIDPLGTPATPGKLAFAPGTGSITFQAGEAVSMRDSRDTIVASGRNLEISGARISLGNIDTSSNSGDGGSVTLSASGNINTGDVSSFSSARNGAGNLTNTGGAVTIKAGGSITSGIINTAVPASLGSGGANGAVVTIKSSGDSVILAGINDVGQRVTGRVININTPNILSAAEILNARTDVAGGAGEVRIGDPLLGLVPSSITVSAISARNLFNGGDGGNITVNTTGSFKATGAFSLQSGKPIASDDPKALSLATEASGNGGVISITASGGIITAAAIVSDSRGTGDGGNIALNSQNGKIRVGNIDSEAQGTGGSVALSAFGDIDTGYIYTALSDSNKLASVSLTSQSGSIGINGASGNRNSIFARSISFNAPGSLFTVGSLNARSDNSGGQAVTIVGNSSQVNTIPSSISIGGVLSARNLGALPNLWWKTLVSGHGA